MPSTKPCMPKNMRKDNPNLDRALKLIFKIHPNLILARGLRWIFNQVLREINKALYFE